MKMTADSARVRGRRVTFCPTKRQHSTLLPRGGHLASPWLFSKLAIPPVARSSASSIWTRLAGCPPCGVLELKYSFASPGRAEEGQGQSQRQHRSRTVRAAKSAAFLHTSFDRRRWSIDQKSDKMSGPPRKGKNRVPLYALAKVASVAAGVQFGWALQLSLLTPYVQELGIPHQWASLIWLCGPISGMIVQPIVGHYSDQSESKWGRRRPFIFTGASLVVVAVLTIAFSADIGRLFGDTQANKTWAIVVFVIGFWLLDLANNTLQGPCRALLADLTGKDQRRNRRANAFFSLFMAVGNVLGFATGAFEGWYKVFPFTVTDACDTPCANLKSAFLIGVLLLALTTFLSVTAATEVPWVNPNRPVEADIEPRVTTPLLTGKEETTSGVHGTGNGSAIEQGKQDADGDESDDEGVVEPETEALFWEILTALRTLPRPMWYLLLVTALTWLAWFPFLLFDTDWMGREVYKGEPTSGEAEAITALYYSGVHMGAFGLMLNSVVLGLTSLVIEPLCRILGSAYLWAIGNVVMTLCLGSTWFITKAATKAAAFGPVDPPSSVTIPALIIFTILGAPLAITYSVPYALTATFTNTSGGGQGLSMGVLNLGVVLPQVIVSIGAGPWDELFGGGNLPAFMLAAASALLGSIAAVFLLPRPPPDFKVNMLRRTRSSPIP